jgi:hypothetical protein
MSATSWAAPAAIFAAGFLFVLWMVRGGQGLRAASALVRRRLQVYWSYRYAVYASIARYALVLTLLLTIGPLVMRFIISGLVPRDWGLTDTEILLIGIVAWPVVWEGYEVAHRNIRSEQYTGIFEVLIPTPMGIGVLPAAYLLLTLLASFVAAFVTFPIILYAFDEVTFQLTVPMALTTASILLTAMFMTWGLGLAFGGLAAVVREMGPVSDLMKLVFLALCGAYIPLALFPPWARTLSAFLPLTPVFDALHGAFAGATFANGALVESYVRMLAWTIGLVALGLWGYRALLDRARRMGTVYGY